MGAGTGDDWIETFLAYTNGVPSPEVFRLWSAIGAVAAALERRTWVEAARRTLYPNLFVLLVGPPGSGKTEGIDPAKELLVEAKKFKIAPDNFTKAALVDTLTDADRKIVLPDNRLVEYHSLAIFVSEFGVLISAHDLEFLSVLNALFDNPKSYRERRRHFDGGKERSLVHPQLNIVAGVQPLFLSSILPDEAWGQGFTSRLIMIYADRAPTVSLWSGSDISQSPLRGRLIGGLGTLAKLLGRWYWDSDAGREVARWQAAGLPPVPEYSKLAYYNSRRLIHLLKLCIVSAASRLALSTAPEMRITLPDVNRARDWLLHAELRMPDIFRGMAQKSDGQLIYDLHHYMWKAWNITKKPLHEAQLLAFLRNRTTSERVLRVLEIAERSNVMTRDAGTKLYIPRPLSDHAME